MKKWGSKSPSECKQSGTIENETRILRSAKSLQKSKIKEKVRNNGSKSLPNKKSKNVRHSDGAITFTSKTSHLNCKKSLLKHFDDVQDIDLGDDVPLGKLLGNQNDGNSSATSSSHDSEETNRTLRPRRSPKHPSDFAKKFGLTTSPNNLEIKYNQAIEKLESTNTKSDMSEKLVEECSQESKGSSNDSLNYSHHSGFELSNAELPKDDGKLFSLDEVEPERNQLEIKYCTTKHEEKLESHSVDFGNSPANVKSNLINDSNMRSHKQVILDIKVLDASDENHISPISNGNSLLWDKPSENKYTNLNPLHSDDLPSNFLVESMDTDSKQESVLRNISPIKNFDSNFLAQGCYNSPSNGILRKRKLQGTDWSCSPSPKMRRVAFSEVVSTLEIPNRHDILSVEESKYSSHEQIKGEGNVTKSTQSMNKENGAPIFLELVDSTSPIEVILPRICSSPWVRGLKNLLSAKNIKTVGDMAAMSEIELEMLPIPQPKSSRTKEALQHWMDQTNSKNKKTASAHKADSESVTSKEASPVETNPTADAAPRNESEAKVTSSQPENIEPLDTDFQNACTHGKENELESSEPVQGGSAGETALRLLGDLGELFTKRSSNEFSKSQVKAIFLKISFIQNRLAECIDELL